MKKFKTLSFKGGSEKTIILPQVSLLTLEDYLKANKELKDDSGETQKIDDYINMQVGELLDSMPNNIEITSIEIPAVTSIDGHLIIAIIHYKQNI